MLKVIVCDTKTRASVLFPLVLTSYARDIVKDEVLLELKRCPRKLSLRSLWETEMNSHFLVTIAAARSFCKTKIFLRTFYHNYFTDGTRSDFQILSMLPLLLVFHFFPIVGTYSCDNTFVIFRFARMHLFHLVISRRLEKGLVNKPGDKRKQLPWLSNQNKLYRKHTINSKNMYCSFWV